MTSLIEAERDAAMRRRAKTQCAQQMAEERLSIFRADAERFEHFLLQFWLVNSNAAAADLHAVEHDVIGLGTNLRKNFFASNSGMSAVFGRVKG